MLSAYILVFELHTSDLCATVEPTKTKGYIMSIHVQPLWATGCVTHYSPGHKKSHIHEYL